jgi:trehalose 6-phosphate phosphatase
VPYLFEHLDSIEKLVRQAPFGLITDVDGTISPIAPTPQEARVSPLCHEYLSILCTNLALVAAISGRPAREVEKMVGIDGIVYIGNHGLERLTGSHYELSRGAEDYPEVIQAVIKELQGLSLEGVIVEDKGISASVHYRLAPEPGTARSAIMAAIEGLREKEKLELKSGKKVVDIRPSLPIDKGTAVRDLIESYNLHGGIYLGDDLTDIDAFRAIRSCSVNPDFHGLALGIISPEMPYNLVDEADFTLNGVADVERFLRWLSQLVAG